MRVPRPVATLLLLAAVAGAEEGSDLSLERLLVDSQ